MRVLLTGATGFIGSHVARELLNRGCDVFATVRESSDFWRIQHILPRLNLLRVDLNSTAEIASLPLDTIRPEVCLHLAWYAVPGRYLHAIENLAALTGSIKLATALAKVGCRRFVGVGTCAEYDSSVGYLKEDSPTCHGNLYAATKLSLCMILEALQRDSGLPSAWIRLFYQYGPFEDERRLVPSVITALLRERPVGLSQGLQQKDFLHVMDVAGAICAIAFSALDGVVNIGSGRPTAVRDIAMEIGKLLGRTQLLRFGEIKTDSAEPLLVCADNNRLLSTGWRPQFDLRTGLIDTIEWWRAAVKS